MNFINIEVKSDFRSLPSFPGSMLRGGFGAALKDVVCINPSKECEGCFGAHNCLYYDFFEEKKRFHNFRFDFKLQPKKLDFSILLINDATTKYPYVLSALHKMITQKGLGVERKRAQIQTIFINDKKVFDGSFKENIQIKPKTFQIDTFCPVVKVKLVTPLRMKRKGRYIRNEELDIKDILVSIAKKQHYYDGIEQQIDTFGEIVSKNLHFIDFTRYSNRQKTKMKIGGLVGEMVVKNLSPIAYRLLRYGEISGVGKLGTFGLGKIEVEDLI